MSLYHSALIASPPGKPHKSNYFESEDFVMKRVLSSVFCFLLIVCISPQLATPASAKTASSAEELWASFDSSRALDKAIAGYIGEDVGADVLQRIHVSGADSYSVEYIGEIVPDFRSTASEGKMYAITATRKSASGSTTEDSVDATITMVWIDNLGTSNEIYQIYGSWTPNGRNLSNRVVTYGSESTLGAFADSMRPTTNSYDFYPLDENYNRYKGFKLYAIASVNSAGYTDNPIMVEAHSSAIQ